MAMQTPSKPNRPSDELSRVTQELTQAQGELQQYRQKLAVLHRLTDGLACAPDEETILKVLAKELPTLIDTVLVGSRGHIVIEYGSGRTLTIVKRRPVCVGLCSADSADLLLRVLDRAFL